MKSEALLLAKKHDVLAEQLRFSTKLEWIEQNGRLVLRKARVDPHTQTITLYTDAIAAQWPREAEQNTLGTLVKCISVLKNTDWDEAEHPRDEDGKFTFSGGGANDGGDAAIVGANEPELDPDVVEVGGDEWNRQTAIRLEKEYQKAKPELESLLHKSVGEEVDTAVDEEELKDNAPYVPDSWGTLSDDQQEEVKTKWKENTKENFLDNEIQSWQESGSAAEEARYKVVQDFKNGFKGSDETKWAEDVITDFIDSRVDTDNPVPYDAQTVLSSLELEYDGNGEGTGDLKVDFNSDKLSSPQGYDPNQQLLPGIEEIHPSSYLSVEMRDELTAGLEKAFDKRADDVAGDIEPPDYLSENVDEYQDEYWDQKEDDEKFEIAKNDTDIINEAQQSYDEYFANNGNSGAATEIAIPDKFDPLQTEGGSDYKKTHALVTFMSHERGYQLLQQRGLVKETVAKQTYLNSIRQVDNNLWRDWKESSAGSFGGQILQLASHEELGARYREMPTDRESLVKQANSRYGTIGGFNGVKALVRAKWETSQYALDKAGIDSLPVYRGLKVNMPEDEPVQEIANGVNTPYAKFTEAQITRNGAYSTTTERSVANGWNAGVGTKVVLRIDAPRTAVLSFPAYGINVHSEKEVVLAGTAFRNWDAWRDRAPSADEVPIHTAKAA